MSEGHSLWLEVIPSSEADRNDGFDRRFDGDGNPPDWEGVAVLCRRPDDGALLMVLQAEPDETPTWALPGGAIEPGETLAQAAVREAKEETGLEVQLLRAHLKVRGVYDTGSQAFSYHIYYFEAAVVGGTLESQRSGWHHPRSGLDGGDAWLLRSAGLPRRPASCTVAIHGGAVLTPPDQHAPYEHSKIV